MVAECVALTLDTRRIRRGGQMNERIDHFQRAMRRVHRMNEAGNVTPSQKSGVATGELNWKRHVAVHR